MGIRCWHDATDRDLGFIVIGTGAKVTVPLTFCLAPRKA